MYDIVGKRNLWFAISALLTIPGLIFIFLGGLRPSIDFTGGTEWEVRYAEEPTAAEMTDALAELGYDEAVVTPLPDGYLRIRTAPIDLIPAETPGPSPSAAGSASASAVRVTFDLGRCIGLAVGRAIGVEQRVRGRIAVHVGESVGRAITCADRRGHRVRGPRGRARGPIRPGRSSAPAHGRPDHRFRSHP